LGFHFSVNCSESLEEETEYKHKNWFCMHFLS
jgi:hypothetical protein